MPATRPLARCAGLFGLLGLLAGQPPAAAADAHGQYGVCGAGLVSCAIYEREREARSPVYLVIAAWMDGYITGSNQYAPDTYDITSFESTEMLAAEISENCRLHPDTPVFAVLNSLMNQVADDRLHEPSKKVEVKLGERSVLLYEEVLRRLQQRLAAGGFYTGPIDGAFSTATREAIGRYQTSIQLNPTGSPDQVTLWRLLRSPRIGSR